MQKCKKNFLIDDVINLSSATDKLVAALSLKDYQIIEKKKKIFFFSTFDSSQTQYLKIILLI